MIPNLTESVSLGKDGKLHVTITNASLTESADIEMVLTEAAAKSVKASVLTGDMRAHNTFDAPDVVESADYTAVKIADGKVVFTAPACSVMHLEVEI